MRRANGSLDGNYRRQNALTPEVARQQSVHDRADFAFGSRRLQTSLASTLVPTP